MSEKEILEETSVIEGTTPVEEQEALTPEQLAEAEAGQGDEEGSVSAQDLFNELDLSGEFTDVNDVLKKSRDNQRYRTQLEQDNNQLKQMVQDASLRPPEPTTIDPEKLVDDPYNSIRDAGFIHRDEVKSVVAEEMGHAEARSLINDMQRPENRATADEMRRLLLSMPELNDLPEEKAVKVLHRMATNNLGGQKTVVQTTDPAKKTRAVTGKPGVSASKKPAPARKSNTEIAKMSLQEMRDYFGYGDDG